MKKLRSICLICIILLICTSCKKREKLMTNIETAPTTSIEVVEYDEILQEEETITMQQEETEVETTSKKEYKKVDKQLIKLLDFYEELVTGKQYEDLKIEDSYIVEKEEPAISTKSVLLKSDKSTSKENKTITILGPETIVTYQELYPELFEYKYIEPTTKAVETKPTETKETKETTVKATTKKVTATSTDKVITIGSVKLVFKNVNGYTVNQPSNKQLRYTSADSATIVDCIGINPTSSTRYLENAYRAATRMYGDGNVLEESVKNSNIEKLTMYVFQPSDPVLNQKPINICCIAQIDAKNAIQINNTNATEAGSNLMKNISMAITKKE